MLDAGGGGGRKREKGEKRKKKREKGETSPRPTQGVYNNTQNHPAGEQ